MVKNEIFYYSAMFLFDASLKETQDLNFNPSKNLILMTQTIRGFEVVPEMLQSEAVKNMTRISSLFFFVFYRVIHEHNTPMCHLRSFLVFTGVSAPLNNNHSKTYAVIVLGC